MTKAFVRLGLLGLSMILLLSVGLTLVLTRSATAQGGGTTDTTILYAPVQLSSEPGQRMQLNMYYYSRGSGQRPAETVCDVLVDVMSPVGGRSIRRTLVIPHLLDVTGRMCRVSLVQNGENNIDVYVN